MGKKIGSYDAKTKLPEILRRVESGEVFTITNRGEPIADLIPSRNNQREKAKSAVASILGMKKHPVSDQDLQSIKEDRRK